MMHSTDTVTLSKTTCCDVCATSWTRARRSIGGKPQPNRRVGPGMFDRLCMSMFSLLLLLGSISPAEIAQAHVVVVKGDLLAVPMPRSSSAKKLWQVLVWTSSQPSSHGTRSAILRLYRLYLGTASDERAIERKGRAGQSLCKLDMEGIAICRR